MIIAVTPPPSTNALYANRRGGRRKTRAYSAWITEALWQIKAQKLKPVHGAVHLCYTAPQNGRRDLGNYEKPLTDLLVTAKLINGDRFKTVKRITMEWQAKSEPCMLIRIEPWQPGPLTSEQSGRLRRGSSASAAARSMPL
jgi:Holliday junction resolvase RusA-like endonuclease